MVYLYLLKVYHIKCCFAFFWVVTVVEYFFYCVRKFITVLCFPADHFTVLTYFDSLKINLSTYLTIVSCRMMVKCWLLAVCSHCHIHIQLQSLSFIMSFHILRFSSVPFFSFPPGLTLVSMPQVWMSRNFENDGWRNSSDTVIAQQANSISIVLS